MMRLFVAQITTYPGDILGNTTKIIETIKEAKAVGAQLVVFPELALPGYLSMDLFNDNSFIEQNKEALLAIAKETAGIAALIGFVDYEETLHVDGSYKKYNSVAFVQDGELKAVVDKTLLPTYDIFDEHRYFQPARNNKPVEIAGKQVGLLICEDMWGESYQLDLAKELVANGAQLIIDVSASPFHVNKLNERKKIINNIFKNHSVPLLYVNLVGSFDGYEGQVVFDGRSLWYDKNGTLQYQFDGFCEQTKLIDTQEQSEESFKPPADNDMEDLFQALVLGVRSYFEITGIPKAFIGLSGGIDSALVAAIAVEALGKERVIGLCMPSQYSSSGSVTDAQALAKNLGIRMDVVPIKEPFTSVKEALKVSFKDRAEDVTEENIQARLRGLYLMAYANKFGGMVLSTGNKTELALGYCTLYGDMSGGLAVISDLSKMRVYALSEYINERAGKELIPVATITKPPSAELAADQTDESSFGASYEIISPLVQEYLEDFATSTQLKKKYPIDLVDSLVWKIHANEHKRRQAAPGIRVTKKAFGVGRRVPLAHKWR